MPDPDSSQEPTTAAEQKLEPYNAKMAALFAERDTHPVDSPERTEVAERILRLWWEEGN